MCAQREAPGRRPAPEEREEVPRERRPEERLLRKVVLHHVRDGVSLQPVAVAPVAQVRDAPVPAANCNEEKDELGDHALMDRQNYQ